MEICCVVDEVICLSGSGVYYHENVQSKLLNLELFLVCVLDGAIFHVLLNQKTVFTM